MKKNKENPSKILGVDDNYKVTLHDLRELEFVKQHPEVLSNPDHIKAILYMMGLDIKEAYQSENIEGGYISPITGISYESCGIVWTGFEREDALWHGVELANKWLNDDSEGFKVAKAIFKKD